MKLSPAWGHRLIRTAPADAGARCAVRGCGHFADCLVEFKSSQGTWGGIRIVQVRRVRRCRPCAERQLARIRGEKTG